MQSQVLVSSLSPGTELALLVLFRKLGERTPSESIISQRGLREKFLSRQQQRRNVDQEMCSAGGAAFPPKRNNRRTVGHRPCYVRSVFQTGQCHGTVITHKGARSLKMSTPALQAPLALDFHGVTPPNHMKWSKFAPGP